MAENTIDEIGPKEKAKIESKQSIEKAAESLLQEAREKNDGILEADKQIGENISKVNKTGPEIEVINDERKEILTKADQNMEDFKNGVGNAIDETEERAETIDINSIFEKVFRKELLTVEEEKVFVSKLEEIGEKDEEELTGDEKMIVFNFNLMLAESGIIENEFIKKTKEDQEKSESEDDKNEKADKKDIDKRKEKIAEELRENDMDIDRDLEGIKELKNDLKKELEAKTDEYSQIEETLSAICDTKGVLDQEGKESLAVIASQLKEIYTHKLHLEEIDYLERYMQDIEDGDFQNVDNPESLINSHDKRNETIENWKKIIEMMETDFSNMNKEEASLFKQLVVWIKAHPKEIALAAGLIAGGLVLGPQITAEGVIKTGIAIAGAKVSVEVVKKLSEKGGGIIKKMAKAGRDGFIFGLFFVDNKWNDVDRFMAWITKMQVPSYAKSERKD